MISSFLCCPLCKNPDLTSSPGEIRCALCESTYPVRDGLPRFLPFWLRDDIDPRVKSRNEEALRRIQSAVWEREYQRESAPADVARRLGFPTDTVEHFLLLRRFAGKQTPEPLRSEALEHNRIAVGYLAASLGKEYEERWMPPESPRELIERLTAFELLGSLGGGSILDLGAGTLRCGLHALQNGADQVVAVDIRAGQLLYGLSKACELNFRERIIPAVADVTYLPVRTGSIHSVISLELLEHIAIDPWRVFLETYRILQPGGRAVIETWNAWPRRMFLRPRNSYFHKGNYYSWMFPAEMEQLFTPLPFSRKEILGSYLRPFHSALICIGIRHWGVHVRGDRLLRAIRPLGRYLGWYLWARLTK